MWVINYAGTRVRDDVSRSLGHMEMEIVMAEMLSPVFTFSIQSPIVK